MGKNLSINNLVAVNTGFRTVSGGNVFTEKNNRQELYEEVYILPFCHPSSSVFMFCPHWNGWSFWFVVCFFGGSDASFIPCHMFIMYCPNLCWFVKSSVGSSHSKPLVFIVRNTMLKLIKLIEPLIRTVKRELWKWNNS